MADLSVKIKIKNNSYLQRDFLTLKNLTTANPLYPRMSVISYCFEFT